MVGELSYLCQGALEVFVSLFFKSLRHKYFKNVFCQQCLSIGCSYVAYAYSAAYHSLYSRKIKNPFRRRDRAKRTKGETNRK